MSSTRWITDPDSGRRYTLVFDQYGRPCREYDAEPENPPPVNSRREDQRIPRSESQHRSTRGPPSTATYITSSKPSTRQRRRRESQSSSQKHYGADDLDDEDEPTPRAPSRYNEPGGYDRPREASRYGASQSYDTPSISRDIPSSRPQSISGSHHGSAERNWPPGTPADPLTHGMTSLTMRDVVGSPQYPLSTSQQDGSSFDRDRRLSQSTHITTGPGMRSGSHRDNEWANQDAVEPRRVPEFPGRQIHGTSGDVEELDSNFKKRNFDYRKFFRLGRVFSTLWTDPYDDSLNNESENQFFSRISIVTYNQKVHSKIRRFVVVRQGDRFCQCLPVFTYDGKGYKKKGISLDEHGLIYSSEWPPKSISGITKEPLKVNLHKSTEMLKNPSYINYARIYAVDTNVKVKEVGELDRDSRGLLRTYFNQVNIIPEDYDAPSIPKNPKTQSTDLAGIGSGLGGSHPAYSNSMNPMSGATQPSHSNSNEYSRSFNTQGQSSPWANTQPTSNALTSYNSNPGYDTPSGQTFQSGFPGVRYSSAPVFDPRRSSTSGGYQPPDGRYMQPHTATPSSGGYNVAISNQFTSTPGMSNPGFSGYTRSMTDDRSFQQGYGNANYGEQYAPGGPSSRNDYYYSNQTTSSGPQWTANPAAPPFSPAAGGYDDQNDDVDLPTLAEVKESKKRRESTSGRQHSSRRDRDRGR